MGSTYLWHAGSTWPWCRDVPLSLNSLRGLRCLRLFHLNVTPKLCKTGNSTLVWEQGCITASEGRGPQQDPRWAALHCVLPPTANCCRMQSWVPRDLCFGYTVRITSFFFISLGGGSSSFKKTFANPCLAIAQPGEQQRSFPWNAWRKEQMKSCWLEGGKKQASPAGETAMEQRRKTHPLRSGRMRRLETKG